MPRKMRFSEPAMLAMNRDARNAGIENRASILDKTGYGVLSGLAVAAQDTPDMTVKVGAGTCFLPNGRRYALAADKTMPVGDVDATRARWAVVYVSADRKMSIASALGTAAVAGAKAFTVTVNAVADDTVTICGVEFAAVAVEATGNQFEVGEDEAATAANLAAAVGANETIAADFDVSVDGATITLTEITAGGGDTPADATFTGTIEITNGTATTSAEAVDPEMPATPENALLLAEVKLAIGATSVQTADIADKRATTTTVPALDARMGTAEAAISDQAEDIAAHAGRLDAAEGTIAEHTSQLAAITDEAIPAYGIAYAGTSAPGLTRTLSAVGLTAAAQVGDTPVVNNFDDLAPWKDIVRVNLADNGTVNAIYGDPTYAADGSNGQVMVRIPAFWYKVTPVIPSSQPIYQVAIAPTPKAGFLLHPAFAGRKSGGGDLECIYVGAYDAATDGTKLLSAAGLIPYVNATRATFRTRARARGANWAQMDFLAASAVQLLYLVEFASWDGQTAIGAGLSNLPYSASHLVTVASAAGNDVIISTANAAAYDIGMVIGIGTSQGGNQIATSRAITAKAAHDGSNTKITFDGAPVATVVGNFVYATGQRTGRADVVKPGKSGREAGATADRSAMVYRGIENLWGNVWTWIDGLNIQDWVWAYCNNIDAYADNTIVGNYTPLEGVAPNTDGYVKAMHFNDWSFRPVIVGGSSTTYIPDYYYQSSGARVLALGGAWSNGLDGGPFCWYASDSSSNVYVRCGGRLLYLPR